MRFSATIQPRTGMRMSVQAKMGNKRNLLCLFCFVVSSSISPYLTAAFDFYYVNIISQWLAPSQGMVLVLVFVYFFYYYCYNRFIFAKMFSLIVVFCCLILKQSIFLIVSIQLHLPRLHPPPPSFRSYINSPYPPFRNIRLYQIF